jgi:hypothetical protein
MKDKGKQKVFNSVKDAIYSLKLDRRRKWYEFYGELIYNHKYAYPCTGCTDTKEMQPLPERGSGCHECGYKGRRIGYVPVPAFMPDGSIVKINPPTNL